MITIISGKYRGRKISGMDNKTVRPTLARVRKSVLQILEPFHGLDVLDLYAGVGTLGIEALSRGAQSVTAVERDYHVFRMMERNFQAICQDDQFQLKRMDVNLYLANELQQFDVVFADPPYRSTAFIDLRQVILPVLKPGGIFCMEMRKTPVDEENIRIKLYGKTQVIFWRSEK